MRISTPAGTAYTSVAPPLLGRGSQDPKGEDEHRPSRSLTVAEDRLLERMQSRINHGEDFTDEDWDRYGHLTWLAAG